MSNKMNANTQQTSAACTPSNILQSQCCYDVGVCNECWYYDTHCGKGWCKKYSRPIEDSSREKDCFTR